MSGSLGYLRIRDRQFAVANATLSGRIGSDGPVEWFLEVDTECAEYDDVVWSPRAYIERYPSSARSVAELLSSSISIQDGAEFCGHTILPGCRLCCLYVFEHCFLDRNLIVFERLEDSRLKMSWTATCAIQWDEEYGQGLDLRIESVVDFLGLAVEAGSELEARRLLAEKFDARGLRYYEEREGGDRYFLPGDVPTNG